MLAFWLHKITDVLQHTPILIENTPQYAHFFIHGLHTSVFLDVCKYRGKILLDYPFKTQHKALMGDF